MSILAWIEDKKRLKLLNAPKYVNSSSDSSKGLWTRCDNCGVILYIKHLKENQRVCFGCSYHLQMNSEERVENLLDKDTWRPFDETLSPCDPLEFHDQKEYTDRLEAAQERTGLQDAIQTGSGMVDGIPVALGVMDFDFMGGSMGSVVGEKITRLIEYATQEGLTLILVCASGGARMQEGVFSLMQMAKISSALQVYQSCANLLYLTILTSPTTGGVTASFAMLGDIIFAEPKALIGFAGRRVIEQTLCEELPEDFQTSEYMLHHGLLDLIVPRRFLRQALSETIRLYKDAPFKKTGNIPFGIQNPMSFITEEKVRRRLAHLKLQPNMHTSSNSSISENNNVNFLVDDVREQADLDLTRHLPLSTTSNNEDKSSFSQAKKAGSADSSLFEVVRKQSTVGLNLTDFAEKSSKTEELGSLQTQSFEEASKNQKTQDFQAVSVLRSNKDSSQYREILTSFQTMFTLFSKEMAVRYLPHHQGLKQSPLQEEADFVKAELLTPTGGPSDPSSSAPPPSEVVAYSPVKMTGVYKDKEETQKALSLKVSREEAGSLQQKEEKGNKLNVPAQSQPPTTDKRVRESDLMEPKVVRNFVPVSSLSDENKPLEQQSLLKMFRHLSETQKVVFAEGDPIDLQNSPSFSPTHTKKEDEVDMEFLNEAIELAANESVEWRAFYIHQKVSKTTGFLEDFAPTQEGEEGRQILENTLFYKAICKEVEEGTKC